MSKQVARTIKIKSGRKSKQETSRRNGKGRGRNHRMKQDDLKLKVRGKAFLYAERAPVIAYSGWESCVKELHFLDWIAHYRIREAKWCVNNEVATEYEAFTYLYTASLATPLDDEWYRIHFYLFNKFYGHLLKHNPIEEVEELTEYEKHLLSELRRWIFKQQMSVLKNKNGTPKEGRSVIDKLEIKPRCKESSTLC